MIENDLKRNASGYIDPTAYKAIIHADSELEQIRHAVATTDANDERYRKLIGCILRMCELSNFSVENRIVLKDKQTGKTYW